MADENKERPLSDEELKYVRNLIEKDKRIAWLWGSLKTYAVWVSAVVLGLGVSFDTLRKFVQYLATTSS